MRVLFVSALLCALAAPLPAVADTPKAYGLREVLSRIRERGPALEAARSQIEVADARVQQAWTGWQPEVTAIGRMTLNSVEAKLDPSDIIPVDMLPIMVDFGPPTVVQPALQLTGILTIQQTLFNMTVLRAPGAAKKARAAVVADVESLADELAFSGATVYVTLLGLEGLEKAARRAEEIAARRIADAEVQVEAGTATPLSVTRARTDKTVAEGQRIAVEAQRRRLLSQLKVLLGEDGPIELRAEPIDALVQGGPQDPYSRSSIVAAQRKIEAAEAQEGLHNLRWLPSIVAEGSLLHQNFDGFAGTPILAQGIFSVVLPIYDRGERYAALAEARAQTTAARRGLDLARREVEAFLEGARADLVASEAELAQAEAQMKLALESVEQAESLASGGLVTPLELADADARRFSADRQVAQKALALQLAKLRLYYATGGRLGAE